MSKWPRDILAATLLSWSAQAHDGSQDGHLPNIRPAPDFTLTSQDGERVSLHDLRGKIVAVTFIFTSCADVCPMLTDTMVRVQDNLGSLFGSRIAFMSITVDPERDTPTVLKQYARNCGADLKGWAFLTGDPQSIREVGKKYGIFARRTVVGEIEHLALTSLIDAKGSLRVQYLGALFDPEEFRNDLLKLVHESLHESE
jgi:protein SCO1/2